MIFGILLIYFISIFSEIYSKNYTTVVVDKISYHIYSLNLIYSDAINECSKNNLSLAYIPNYRVLEEIFSNRTINETYYIGLKYSLSDNFMTWLNGGNQLSNMKWSKTLMSASKFSCVFVQNDIKLNMDSCDNSRYFICSNSTNNNEKIVGNTCPNGFFMFMNKCYNVSTGCQGESITWLNSAQKCKLMNSHLMIVDSFVEQEFLTALMTVTPQPVWMGLTYIQLNNGLFIWGNEVDNDTYILPHYKINFKSGEPNSYGKEKCVMCYHRLTDMGRMNDENCTRSMGYVCERESIKMKNTDTTTKTSNPLLQPGKCKDNYVHFNQSCFLISNEIKNSTIPLVYGRIGISFLRTLMNHFNSEALRIHLYTLPEDVASSSNPKQSTDKDNNNTCYVLFSKLPNITHCSDDSVKSVTLSKVNHYHLINHENQNLHLSCPTHWMKVGNKCFLVEQESVPFQDAVKLCKLRFNGQLATFRSMKEVQSVQEIMIEKKSIWIGLSGDSFLKSKWIDDSPISYCLFRHTQNLEIQIQKGKQNGMPICFVLRSSKGEWYGKQCADSNPYVCQLSAFENHCPPSMPWLINGTCYHASNESVKIPWVKGIDYCQSLHNKSRLASFSSNRQQELLFHMMSNTNKPSPQYWIGLFRQNGDLAWSDQSPIRFLHKFSDLSNNKGYYSCFSASLLSIADSVNWNVDNCALKKQIVCSMDINKPSKDSKKSHANYQFSTICQHQFSYHNNSCFKYIENQTFNWKDAQKYCSKFKNSDGLSGSLAFFDNCDQLNFALSLLYSSNNKTINPFVWIGYYREADTENYISVSEDHLDYFKSLSIFSFNDNLTNGHYIAVSTSYNPYINGQWRNIDYVHKLAFVCRLPPNLVTSSHAEIKPTPQNNCSGKFNLAYQGYCYHLNTRKFVYENAVKYCQELKSDLLVIDDIFEERYIHSTIVYKLTSPHSFWLGVKLNSRTGSLRNWETSDSKPVLYTHWKHLEAPQFVFRTPKDPQHIYKGCLAMDYSQWPRFYGLNHFLQMDYEAGMGFIDCQTRLPVVCKMAVKLNTKSRQSNVDNGYCGVMDNGTFYGLNQSRTIGGDLCVRWDTVLSSDTNENLINYYAKSKLRSSMPYTSDGYLSYSQDFCSQSTTSNEYQCFIYKDGKYSKEKCSIKPCLPKKDKIIYNKKTTIELIMLLMLIGCLVFLLVLYRRSILGNYKVQACLVRVLGRYQPDWLANRGPPVQTSTGTSPSSIVMMINDHGTVGGSGGVSIGTGSSGGGGVGFVNPVYTPLQQQDNDKI